MKKKVREDTPRTNTKKKRRIVLWTVLGLVLAGVALGGWQGWWLSGLDGASARAAAGQLSALPALKTGKVKRAHAFKSHILNKKSTKRKRGLRAGAYADKTNESAIKRMILYK